MTFESISFNNVFFKFHSILLTSVVIAIPH